MRKFTISANGTPMGVYEGIDADAAVEAFARDAGYSSFAELCAETGDNRDSIDVVEFMTTRHLMVTVRPEDEDAPMPSGDGIVEQGDRDVFGPEALKAVAQKLFDAAEADVEAGEYGNGTFRVMVIDYTDNDEGDELHDEIVEAA